MKYELLNLTAYESHIPGPWTQSDFLARKGWKSIDANQSNITQLAEVVFRMDYEERSPNREATTHLIQDAPLLLTKLDEAQKEILRLRKLAKELFEHLEYCGWGDSWERECSEDLQDRARKEFDEPEPPPVVVPPKRKRTKRNTAT